MKNIKNEMFKNSLANVVKNVNYKLGIQYVNIKLKNDNWLMKYLTHKQFTTKINCDKDIPEDNESKYIKRVNDKIETIIEKYKTLKGLSNVEAEYFLENCILYNNKDPNNLRNMLKIINKLIKSTENNIELKSINLSKLTKNYRILIRNNINKINLYDIVTFKCDYEGCNIKSSNVLFILSDFIFLLIEKNFHTLTYLEKLNYVKENYLNIIKINHLPYVKKRFGNLLNLLFIEFLQAKNSTEFGDLNNGRENEIQMIISSPEIQELFYIYYYQINQLVKAQVEELYRLKNNSEKQHFKSLINSNFEDQLKNEENADNPKLNENKKISSDSLLFNFPFLLINSMDKKNFPEGKNGDDNINVRLKFLDNNIFNIMKYIDNNYKDKSYIFKFMEKIGKLLLFRDKSSVTDIREFSNVLFAFNNTNFNQNKFYQKKDPREEAPPNTINQLEKKEDSTYKIVNIVDNYKSIIECQLSFYPQIKTYLYTENNDLKNVFKINHDNVVQFSNNLSQLIINSHKPKFEYTVLNLLEILNSGAYNFMQSDHIEKFFKDNIHEILKISDFNRNIILRFYYKLIIDWLYYGKSSNNYKNILDDILIFYIKSSQIATSNEKEYIVSNLTSIFYHLILNNYEPNNIFKDYFSFILLSLKNSNENQSKILFRFSIILQNLKCQYSHFYEEYKNQLNKIEHMLNIVIEKEGKERRNILLKQIWWQKDYFSYNKYSKNQMIKNIKNFTTEKIEEFPCINNIHYADFKIGEKKFIEFLSPFHYNNDITDNDKFLKSSNEINLKFKRKREIFKYYGFELISIDFDLIIKDINNLKNFLI